MELNTSASEDSLYHDTRSWSCRQLWTPVLFSAHSTLITENPTPGTAWRSNNVKVGSHVVCSTVLCLFKKTFSIFQGGKPSLRATIYSVSVYLDFGGSCSKALCEGQTSRCVVAMDRSRNLDWYTSVTDVSITASLLFTILSSVKSWR